MSCKENKSNVNKKVSFSLFQKITVLKWIQDNNKSCAAASRYFRINERNIQRWEKKGLNYFILKDQSSSS